MIYDAFDGTHLTFLPHRKIGVKHKTIPLNEMDPATTKKVQQYSWKC